MNLLCKLFGHKWRDTSYWEFKRENEKQLRRKITQVSCDRCGGTKIFKINRWQPDIALTIIHKL